MANDDRRQVENCRRDDGGFLCRDDHPSGQMPLQTDDVADRLGQTGSIAVDKILVSLI
jgi:hypothetical protein